ncbi:hypothetical protein [Selenomonas sp. oral taxon 149]|uniref:hypothetical protein n=1 Tax=Selenomonas sp. oral taxon 149 TaxID=712535 RepID=UPI0001E0A777|nr:hypothetical protein [Selenomonas sp. oral taxon 149]EFM23826.1 hypothetical protein HMPREF9166_0570 [Selenomonas sp. oral taxon 149 str. 67H29BP]
MDTLETQLGQVRAAIAEIEGGAQEYSIANRRITKANLATLYARENALKAEIARRDGGDVLFAQMGRL